ncbi:tyrosine-type recombinase/integrase [Aquimarina macrocephali]|uniref:tyrosine-type recombinase/integrase n=1 Tax=Aquimarina macrocephali TaxID=666563 RepID=UPI000463E960|nr:tyrosine-type recombinase/integrase [Aquimarina macrocephali]
MNTPMSYAAYLEKEGYTKSTVKTYEHCVERFLRWANKLQYHIPTFDYKAALRYVKYLKRKQRKTRTINALLIGIRPYFNYLIDIGVHTQNPFNDIVIKGEPKVRMLSNLLSADELEDLYYSYQITQSKNPLHVLTHKRNKVITGLLVYQGLSTADLQRIELEHLHLQKGKVYIPQGNLGNARELELKPWQIIPLMEYVNEVRPELLRRIKIDTEALIFAKTGKLVGVIETLIKKLRKTNQKVGNAHSIRSSVIVLWLSRYNLREVQYMAGHKRISTTEQYQQQDLEELQNTIAKFHPIH